MTAERLQPVPDVRGLLDDPRRAFDLPPAVAGDLLIALAPVVRALELAAGARQSDAAPMATGTAEPRRLMTMPEVAARARKSVRWIRDHWRSELPGGIRRGRTILFREAEVDRWLNRP